MIFHWWRRSNPWLWWMYKLFNQRDTQETETPKAFGLSLNAHSHILFFLSHVARPLNLFLLFSIHHRDQNKDSLSLFSFLFYPPPRPKQRLSFSLFLPFISTTETKTKTPFLSFPSFPRILSPPFFLSLPSPFIAQSRALFSSFLLPEGPSFLLKGLCPLPPPKIQDEPCSSHSSRLGAANKRDKPMLKRRWHALHEAHVGCQLGQVGSQADVVQEVDNMAVSLVEHEDNTFWLLYHGTRHKRWFPRIIARVLVAFFDCIIIQAI